MRVGKIDGIVIYVYGNDHPPPHIHAVSAENIAAIRLMDGKVTDGSLPPKQLRRVRSWMNENMDMLQARWLELNDRRT